METECIRPAQQGLSRTTRDEPKTLGDQCDFSGGAGPEGRGEPRRHCQQAFGDYELYSGSSLSPAS